MFMCTLCKKTGFWNDYETSINQKKTRKPKKQEISSVIPESERIIAALKEVETSTTELGKMDQETLSAIFTKFKLPVSIKSWK